MLTDTIRALAELPVLASMTLELRPRPDDTIDSFAARVEDTAQRVADHTAVICGEQSLTWAELNRRANRCARACRALGLTRGDCVSLIMENRIDFLVSLIALNRLGVISALINTNLTGQSLAHCIAITESKALLFGEECLEAVAAVREDRRLTDMNQYLFVPDDGGTPCPRWALDLYAEMRDGDSGQVPDGNQASIGEPALFIFTSGTTGLPKAAIVSNRRFLLMATMSARTGLRCDEKDCIYLCLPLYHATGLVLGAGAAFNTGACVFLRRKFSATAFLPEVRKHGATCFIYVGEICRYLLKLPEQPDDYANPMTTIMGNGLRPDIWREFKERFGIARVSEFYGASEGNIGMLNLFNRDCTVGTTPLPHTLVKYDIEADEVIRDADGFCMPTDAGEPGLLLGKITANTPFEGYTSSEDTAAKLMRDVYVPGDAWFNTGDLLRKVDVGFCLGLPHYQFVDRVGDTFRWMGENISTNEVGEIINTHPQIHFCNVYGVEIPGTNGRAGMAALLLQPGSGDLDLASFSAHVRDQLPPYARPVFLRVLPGMDTTGTFKMVKAELRRDGFDPARVRDRLYVMKPGATQYAPLDKAFATRILEGAGGY